MVQPDGRIKLLDFGVARLLGAVTLTETSEVVGTAGYLAPEQVANGPVDGRADLFAVGVVLYEMVTGRKPFTAATFNETLSRIVTFDPLPPSRINPALPPSLDLGVAKLLAKKAGDRPASAKEAIELLALREPTAHRRLGFLARRRHEPPTQPSAPRRDQRPGDGFPAAPAGALEARSAGLQGDALLPAGAQRGRVIHLDPLPDGPLSPGRGRDPPPRYGGSPAGTAASAHRLHPRDADRLSLSPPGPLPLVPRRFLPEMGFPLRHGARDPLGSRHGNADRRHVAGDADHGLGPFRPRPPPPPPAAGRPDDRPRQHTWTEAFLDTLASSKIVGEPTGSSPLTFEAAATLADRIGFLSGGRITAQIETRVPRAPFLLRQHHPAARRRAGLAPRRLHALRTAEPEPRGSSRSPTSKPRTLSPVCWQRRSTPGRRHKESIFTFFDGRPPAPRLASGGGSP